MSLNSAFSTSGVRRARAFTQSRCSVRPPMKHCQISCMAAKIEFIKGVEEPTIPDVKLTRSRDGASGVATFLFQNPTVFEASSEVGDITGLYMVDDEGELQTVEVQAKFVNGKPDKIEAKYIMRSTFEWDRFMRFMERYAEDKGLGFQKSGK